MFPTENTYASRTLPQPKEVEACRRHNRGSQAHSDCPPRATAIGRSHLRVQFRKRPAECAHTNPVGPPSTSCCSLCRLHRNRQSRSSPEFPCGRVGLAREVTSTAVHRSLLVEPDTVCIFVSANHRWGCGRSNLRLPALSATAQAEWSDWNVITKPSMVSRTAFSSCGARLGSSWRRALMIRLASVASTVRAHFDGSGASYDCDGSGGGQRFGVKRRPYASGVAKPSRTGKRPTSRNDVVNSTPDARWRGWESRSRLRSGTARRKCAALSR